MQNIINFGVKNAVFWDVTPHGSCKNRRFGGNYRLHTAKVVPSSLIIFSLMMEVMFSCGTSIHTRAKRRRIPEDGILHSHRR
jgi:hypothetical protein